MEYIVIAISAFATSLLTLYTGFGLGTLLLPVFVIFYPIEIAVVATAVVHFSNNVFKAASMGRNADHDLVWQFGLPAVMAAFAGAALLGVLTSSQTTIMTYALGRYACTVTPFKLIMALIMVCMAMIEFHPRLRTLSFERRHLLLGGLLSGFFGGLSGHQGALRATFLSKTGVSTAAFVGSSALIGLMVDAARLLVYGGMARTGILDTVWDFGSSGLVLTGVGMAWLGVITGKRFLHKVTMVWVQNLTGTFLLIIALALGLGIL